MNLRGDEATYFGGTPRAFLKSDLPTHGDVARGFYHYSQDKDFATALNVVKAELVDVWHRCSTELPLKNDYAIKVKIKRFILDVKKLNSIAKNNAQNKPLQEKLDSVKDRLFDISACSCDLPIVGCNDPGVTCTSDPCDVTHILCLCARGFKVPPEERKFLRLQREKVGTFGGQMQIGPRDVPFTRRLQAR